MQAFPRYASEITLVITDIVMPVMNGAELANVVQGHRSRCKGDRDVGLRQRAPFVQNGGHIDCFLKKPFDGVTLISTVRKALPPGAKDSRFRGLTPVPALNSLAVDAH